MDITELSSRLRDKAEALLQRLFNGQGKISAGKFSIGNVNGDPGNSLFIYLLSGRFKDVATGQSGDLLELIALKIGSKKEAIEYAYSFLGMHKQTTSVIKKKAIKPWQKPSKEWSQLTDNPKCLKYLTEDRRIQGAILHSAGVRAKEDKHYCFLTYTHEATPVICGANYIGLKRAIDPKTGKPKKDVFQSDKPLATLFGHINCDMTITNASNKKYLIITEGQIDCLSYRTQGLTNSVSVPFGTGADDWIENSWDWMMKFDEIYLSFDNDTAGQAAMEKTAKRIGYEKCKKIVLPGDLKDANAAHCEGKDLHDYVNTAEEFKPDKLIESSEIHNEAISRLKKGRRENQGTPFLGWEGDESINFRLRPKEMTIYTGYPGEGKSNILYQLVAFLVFEKRETVVIASLEEDAEEILGLIYIHALGVQYNAKNKNNTGAFEALREEARKKIFFYHHRNRAPFADVLLTAEFTIRKHGAQHFIMDSVAKTDLNIEKNEDANEFVGLITGSMNDTGAHYHVVAHARKGPNKNKWEMPGLQEIKGANAFGVETFNCLSMWRDPRKTEMLLSIREKGYYEMREFNNDAPVESGQFKKGISPFKTKRMEAADVAKVPDGVVWVCKQKVGGECGKYDIYFNRENYRVSRHSDSDLNPYAKDVYDHFITNEGGEADF